MYDVTISRKLAMALSVGFLVLLLGGCEQEGPAEQAGEEIDRATEEASKAMEKAHEKMEETIK